MKFERHLIKHQFNRAYKLEVIPIRQNDHCKITLAHGGALVLNNVAEFNHAVMRAVGQAVGQGSVTLARTTGRISLPAHSQIIALANPCLCGRFGGEGDCTCSSAQIQAYQRRVNELVGDMVDIRIGVRTHTSKELLDAKEGASSDNLREAVLRARNFAKQRETRDGKIDTTSKLIASCHLDSKTQSFVENATRADRMNGSDIVKTLKIARTIADMVEAEVVTTEHISEALMFRNRSI